jgi:hypothetical protein
MRRALEMQEIDVLERRYEHDPAVVTRRVAGEVILVPVRPAREEAALYTLDEVAAFLWERLDGLRTGHELVAALQSEYEVDESRAASDVRVFLEQLLSIEAIRPAADAQATRQPVEGALG